jgi:predicted ribosomally synthesized peptide with nif11-like leader
MSTESARGFVRKLIADEEFREEVQSTEDPATRVQLAEVAGFEFSAEDLETALAEMAEAETVGDLMDNDEVVGFALGNLVGLQNHVLVPFYGDGNGGRYFATQGQLKLLGVRAPEGF